MLPLQRSFFHNMTCRYNKAEYFIEIFLWYRSLSVLLYVQILNSITVKKIALITPMLQPYRLSFYDKLNNFSPDTQWIIFHGVKRTEDGRPAYSGETAFNNIGLIEIKYEIGPFTLLVHKGLYREIVKFNPDLIIIQSITGNLSYRRIVNWAKRNGKIIINWACAWEPGNAKGLLLKFKNIFVRAFYKKGNACLAYSTKAKRYIIDRGIDASSIEVCYNGIEIDNMLLHENEILVKSAQISKQLSLDNFTVFLYVGGLLPLKRVDLLIDAFEIIRSQNVSAKLLIIGDGPMKAAIVEKINMLKDENITYLGRIIDDVDPYFAASSCLVLPGVGGLAINQGMFWRKICITSEADGTEEDLVIEAETGFRFLKDNITSLVEAMLKVVNLSESERELMGNKARNIIETQSNVNNMVNIFTKAIIRFFPELDNKG